MNLSNQSQASEMHSESDLKIPDAQEFQTSRLSASGNLLLTNGGNKFSKRISIAMLGKLTPDDFNHVSKRLSARLSFIPDVQEEIPMAESARVPSQSYIPTWLKTTRAWLCVLVAVLCFIMVVVLKMIDLDEKYFKLAKWTKHPADAWNSNNWEGVLIVYALMISTLAIADLFAQDTTIISHAASFTVSFALAVLSFWMGAQEDLKK